MQYQNDNHKLIDYWENAQKYLGKWPETEPENLSNENDFSCKPNTLIYELENHEVYLIITIFILLWGCPIISNQTISQSWSGLPVEALDTHSYWLTIPMKKSTQGG